MNNALNTAATAAPRWGEGHVNADEETRDWYRRALALAKADPRTRYRAALDRYRYALDAVYGEEISGAEFAAMAREEAHYLADLEVVVGVLGGPLYGNEEVVTEREPTPAEWADAAEEVAYRFCESYIVSETLHPGAGLARELADFQAGIIR